MQCPQCNGEKLFGFCHYGVGLALHIFLDGTPRPEDGVSEDNAPTSFFIVPKGSIGERKSVMKKTIFALIAVVAVLTGCKKEETYDPENVAVTSDVLLVTESTATIQGIAHLTTYDLRFYGYFGVEICTDNLFDEKKVDEEGNPTMKISYQHAPLKGKIDDEGRFTVDFSSLEPGTLYYYRTAVNYNSIGLPEGNHCFRGETRTFKTKSLPE